MRQLLSKVYTFIRIQLNIMEKRVQTYTHYMYIHIKDNVELINTFF